MPKQAKDRQNDPVPADVILMFDRLKAKTELYDQYYQYYDGEHPETFLSERLRRLFADIDVNFTENWCGVVIDSMLDRTAFQGFTIGNAELATESATLIEDLKLALEADLIHEAAYVTGEAFFIAGYAPPEGGQPAEPPAAEQRERGPYIPPAPNGKGPTPPAAKRLASLGDRQIEAFANDPRCVHVEYETYKPRQMRVAAKWYVDDEGYRRLILYYPDRIEFWTSTQKADKVRNGKSFKPDDPPSLSNTYDRIPVFHFRTNLRKPRSELASVIDPQSVVNKSLNDQMAASEYASFKQKWVITQADIPEGSLENDPGVIMEFPGSDGQGQQTQVGEFGQSDLGDFTKIMDREVAAIAAITRTPAHHFLGGAGANLSGEALIALEAPLNKKVGRRIKLFRETWVELWAFVLQLAGHQVDPKAIKALYEKPETVLPVTRSKIRQTNKDAGLPIRWTLKYEEGKSDDELKALDQEIAAEDRRQANKLGEGLMQLQAGQPVAETKEEAEGEPA